MLNLDYDTGISLINKAYEKTIEQHDWDLYISIYPNMDKDSFISFEQFKNKKKLNNKQTSMSNEDILKKAEEVKKIHQGKHEGVVKD